MSVTARVQPGSEGPVPGRQAVLDALQRLDQPFAVARDTDQVVVVRNPHVQYGSDTGLPMLAMIPALTPDRLGDANFRTVYGVRANYVAGAMANGIGSEDIVIEMAKAGLLGFFGAAGLPTPRIQAAIETIQGAVGDLPCGFNLIHSPHEPFQEQETVDLYLARGVTVISAAAYLGLTPQIVQYRASGLTQGPTGEVMIKNRILAKISREEVADKFLRPAPRKMLDALVRDGKITANEAALAARIPMADDLTAEADSGGHTDNQPMPVLLPLIIALRDRLQREYQFTMPVRVGVAGGISTPASCAAAFALGAAYVVTGTVNQACVESGTSPMVKQMLAQAGVNDVAMAPASDMFEAGVEVQVLKRGTLFAQRGTQLYHLYRRYDSIDAIPADVRKKVETSVFRKTFDEVWSGCVEFFSERDPRQLERAARDPKHKLALCCRWYLGLSSYWAISGDTPRRMDTQIWCGPAIGAFNDWTRGTFLEAPDSRRVAVVAANLMAGAAALTRATWLSQQGVDAGPEAHSWRPRPLMNTRNLHVH